jgi:hypothetical protein
MQGSIPLARSSSGNQVLSQPLSAMRQSALGNALSTILAPLWSLAFREQHESPAITIADGMELRVQTAHPFFRRLAAVRGPSDMLRRS